MVKKNLHHEEAGEEEQDADSCDVNVTLAHPTVAYGSRWEEGHKDDGALETHLCSNSVRWLS